MSKSQVLPQPLSLFARVGPASRTEVARPPMQVAGLFAGIGGIELGLAQSGHRARLLCEIDLGAMHILKTRFPDVALHDDVRSLRSLPTGTELLTAGFPCQDLSQAGKTVGIEGARSGLVGEVFRLLEGNAVPWVLIENVPFMLQLSKGRALDVIISALEHLGYKWAYRVVDARAFGVPQRRERVYILASRAANPCDVLLSDCVTAPQPEQWGRGRSFGFYWTEGIRGLGAAVDAVPTLKGGSTIGIPSPPAIILPSRQVITPDIRDAERLQGFPEDWTKPVEDVQRRSTRWKYVGNAVAVHVAAWIGERLRRPKYYFDGTDRTLLPGTAWPRAAYNIGHGRRIADVTAWPRAEAFTPIHEFLRHERPLLSEKATAGFLSRTEISSLRFPDGFIPALQQHLAHQRKRAGA